MASCVVVSTWASVMFWAGTSVSADAVKDNLGVGGVDGIDNNERWQH